MNAIRLAFWLVKQERRKKMRDDFNGNLSYTKADQKCQIRELHNLCLESNHQYLETKTCNTLFTVSHPCVNSGGGRHCTICLSSIKQYNNIEKQVGAELCLFCKLFLACFLHCPGLLPNLIPILLPNLLFSPGIPIVAKFKNSLLSCMGGLAGGWF